MKYRHLLSSIALLPLLSQAQTPHVHGNGTLFVAIDQQQVLLELETPAANILGFEHAPSTAMQKNKLAESVATLADYTSIIQFNGVSCQLLSADIDAPFSQDDEHEEHGSHDKHDDHEKHGSHDKHDDHEKHGSHDKHDDHEKHGSHEKHDDHEKHGSHDKHDDHEEHGSHDKHDDHEEHGSHDKHDDHEEHGSHDKHDDHEDHSADTHSDFHVNYTLKCDGPVKQHSATVNGFNTFTGFEKMTVNWLTNDKQGTYTATPSNTQLSFK